LDGDDFGCLAAAGLLVVAFAIVVLLPVVLGWVGL
jgi:hypothetical protein